MTVGPTVLICRGDGRMLTPTAWCWDVTWEYKPPVDGVLHSNGIGGWARTKVGARVAAWNAKRAHR